MRAPRTRMHCLDERGLTGDSETGDVETGGIETSESKRERERERERYFHIWYWLGHVTLTSREQRVNCIN